MELDTLSHQQEELMRLLENYLQETHEEASRTQTLEIKKKLDQVEDLLKNLVTQLKKH